MCLPFAGGCSGACQRLQATAHGHRVLAASQEEGPGDAEALNREGRPVGQVRRMRAVVFGAYQTICSFPSINPLPSGSMMTDYTEKKCPQCGQQLRFPNDIGGILMACPSCGNRFHSDFRVGSINRSSGPAQRGVSLPVFEIPYKIVSSVWKFFLHK